MNFEVAIFDNKKRHFCTGSKSNAVSAVLNAFRQVMEHYVPDTDQGRQAISQLTPNQVYSMFRVVEVSDTFLSDPRPLKDGDIRGVMILTIWDPRSSSLPLDPEDEDTPFWFDPDGTIVPVGYIRPVM